MAISRMQHFSTWKEFKAVYCKFNALLGAEHYLTKLKEIDDIAKICKLEPIKQSYETFFIPKSNGEERRIDNPLGNTRKLQARFRDFLEDIGGSMFHACAHAYIKGRSCLTALKIHQDFESEYFLKIDIKDFFPSIGKEFLIKELKNIFPANGFFLHKNGETYFDNIIACCILNGGLPQGSPCSPILTNFCMLQSDGKISKKIGENFAYTRFADDIIISAKKKFDFEQMENDIQKILSKANSNFLINKDKTKFTKISNKNELLGLVINKKQNIVLTHKTKKTVKNLAIDYAEKNLHSIKEMQIMQGHLSYCKSVEPKFAENLKLCLS
ncbi:hypothetical protein AGMMS49938_18420 [Fibrobacterales bacterium]|nr:hypothetical protein AGMMS49938_18420 [Fibrobacterales bacterium]